MTESADDLFKGQELPSGSPAAAVAMPAAVPAVAAARVLRPERRQIQMRASDLESLLQPGHRARLVWSWVERQDLSTMYAGIKAVQGGVGRAAIAPEILLALWLYATLEGVGSARQLARMTDSHDAYRWLCGGVQVNHHSLSDFRVEHGQALDELLSVSVASPMRSAAITLGPSTGLAMRMKRKEAPHRADSSTSCRKWRVFTGRIVAYRRVARWLAPGQFSSQIGV